MSKSTIRTDKTCLNCRHVVERKFCPNCGQENSDSRKTFHQLFIHFFEDLTHYENAFWKTIRNLILKPGSLTTEYLSGKRLSYLAPVRLYIFISFITFLILASIYTPTLSDNEADEVVHVQKPDSVKLARLHKLVEKGVISQEEANDAVALLKKQTENTDSSRIRLGRYKSVEDLDHQYKNKTGDQAMGEQQYKVLRKVLPILERYSTKELGKKLVEAMMHNFPKALFIYMPLFAFFLWIFHDKRKWYYFDHGIFTLHYFSFLLLIMLIMLVFSWLIGFCGDSAIVTFLDYLVGTVGCLWMLYYFFPAHHRFYGETRAISLIKSIGLLFINMFFGLILLVGIVIYSFLTLH